MTIPNTDGGLAHYTVDLLSWAIMVKCCESQALDFKSFNLLFTRSFKIFNKTTLPIYSHYLELPLTRYSSLPTTTVVQLKCIELFYFEKWRNKSLKITNFSSFFSFSEKNSPSHEILPQRKH
jgi:hypothetical protein